MAEGYSIDEVAALLKLSGGAARQLAETVLPRAPSSPRASFSFQDLVVLKAAKALVAGRVPRRRVRDALSSLRSQLATHQPLSAVQLSLDNQRIVAQAGAVRWQPETGQVLMDFPETPERPTSITNPARSLAAKADAWYRKALDLEDRGLPLARDAYRRVLALDPTHADAHVNLGRLLHLGGEPAEAEKHYRAALEARPHDATAHFNLGVALEDQGRFSAAVRAYEVAIAVEPGCLDAHFNLARLFERTGDKQRALRHLKEYRRLSAR